MASTTYRIMAAGSYGGDALERKCWPLFLQRDFPSYETFWKTRVVPVTTRPQGMWFKSDVELAAIGRGPEDLCLAQLHYTILGHLDVANSYRGIASLEATDFTHAILRLSSVTDIADEILERIDHPGQYDPWSERAGMAARSARRSSQRTLQDIRNYRNFLVHGRFRMAVRDGGTNILYFIKIGREPSYIDWRTITLHSNVGDVRRDFAPGHDILEEAWREVTGFLESSWRAIP